MTGKIRLTAHYFIDDAVVIGPYSNGNYEQANKEPFGKSIYMNQLCWDGKYFGAWLHVKDTKYLLSVYWCTMGDLLSLKDSLLHDPHQIHEQLVKQLPRFKTILLLHGVSFEES
jgi:hypothetical protein